MRLAFLFQNHISDEDELTKSPDSENIACGNEAEIIITVNKPPDFIYFFKQIYTNR